MIAIFDHTFTDTSVLLDGHSYIRCRFVRVRLVYGGGDFVLEQCAFDGTMLVPVGAAHRTLFQVAPLFGWSYSPPHERLPLR